MEGEILNNGATGPGGLPSGLSLGYELRETVVVYFGDCKVQEFRGSAFCCGGMSPDENPLPSEKQVLSD